MNFLKVLVPDQGSESCLDPGLCYSGVCVCDAMVRDKKVTLVVQICSFAQQVILYKDDRSASSQNSLYSLGWTLIWRTGRWFLYAECEPLVS
jgi:hypothetical protein